MKGLIISFGVILGLFLGLYPNMYKPKPLIWKIIAGLIVTASICMSLLPPLGSNLQAARYVFSKIPDKSIDIYVYAKQGSEKYDGKEWQMKVYNANTAYFEQTLIYKGEHLPSELKSGSKLIITTKYDNERKAFIYLSTEYFGPLLVLPFVPALDNQVRILNFHVPVAWVSVLAYLISMVFSIVYLRTKNPNYDLKATAAAGIGTVFCILTTLTGMLWAKFNWGSFWNWDPRETSIFILLLIYGAYFSLRSAIENHEVKARLSAVYSILAFITVPFLVFVLPRILEGLHPGSTNDTTTGPVLSGREGALDFTQQFAFSLGLCSFTLIFFWINNLYIRYKLSLKQILINQ